MANVHNIRIRGRLPYNIVEKGSERVKKIYKKTEMVWIHKQAET